MNATFDTEPAGGSRLARTCMIGAGSSGIAAAKALHERGIPFDCFEKSDRVGGNWVFANKNGMSAAYRDLFINTSRDRMAYADLPMPETYPDFPHHTQIAAYFDDYVDHFGFRDRIIFETGVEHAARRDDGAWRFVSTTGETREYDALLVANGHHWNPRWPEPAFPGSDTFAGEQMHAHSYIDNSIFAGKRVVVLGMGNSAMDIAVESSYVAERTYLAARQRRVDRPQVHLRQTGRPDCATTRACPSSSRQRFIQQLVAATPARPSATGCQSPTTASARLTRRSPGASSTASSTARSPPSRTSSRWRARACASSTARASRPTWSSTAPATRSPFRSSTRTSSRPRRTTSSCFAGYFTRTMPNVAFIGLLQPLGAIMPLAEAQGAWVGDYLARRLCRCRVRQTMRADIAADQASMRKRYVASKRHTIQVDFDDYLYALEKERAAGAQRARAKGYEPPLRCPRSAATAAS